LNMDQVSSGVLNAIRLGKTRLELDVCMHRLTILLLTLFTPRDEPSRP
jgi:hypothetical protein